MRVWKIKIGPETSKTSGPNGLPEPVTFHVAAEHSLDTLRPQLDVMPPPREIDVADIMDRVSKMAQEIKAAVKKNVAENG